MKRLFLLIAIFATGIHAQAQDAGDFSIGIKAGLNFATFAGPSERSSTDVKLETNSIITRFLIAPTFRYALTDRTGLLLEVQYSQKGGNYAYTGESYWILETPGLMLALPGNRSVSLNVNNGYLDIPLMFYGRANSRVSFYGGPYIGFLLNSTGAGQLSFDARPFDLTNIEVDLQPFNIELDHDYKKDPQDDFTLEYQPIFNVNSVGGLETFPNTEVPRVADAYYDFEEKDGDFYNPLDYGLVGGVEYRFETGLGIGLRASYGLADITNNAYDYSKVTFNEDLSRIAREDRDRNLVIQLYIGFEL